MKKVFDAVVTTGEYVKNGETKKQYRTIGAVLQGDDGRLSLKLEMIPVVGFTGWINFYEPREKEQKAPPQRSANDDGGFSDEIPF